MAHRGRMLTPRRRKEWSGLPGTIFALTSDSTTAGGILAFAGSGNTILRMMGGYVIGPTSAPAAVDRVVLTVAMGIVSSDAASAGSASLPDPADEPEYPWLYWRQHALFFAGVDPEASAVGAGVRESFDVRS